MQILPKPTTKKKKNTLKFGISHPEDRGADNKGLGHKRTRVVISVTRTITRNENFP